MANQARRSIHEELLTIPGIVGAAFDGDATQPTGVKIQLAPGADPDEVGRRVRRVLAGHGMRSQLTAPDVAPSVPPPPPQPRTVINLSDFGQTQARGDAAMSTIAEPDEGAAEEPDDDAGQISGKPGAQEAAAAVLHGQGAASSVPVLRDVTITQAGSSVTVSVAAGGRSTTRRAAPSEGGMDRALLGAMCELLDVDPEPALVEVGSMERDGTTVVWVLLDDGVGRRSGSAVDRGNRSWAVARALWSAVSGPA